MTKTIQENLERTKRTKVERFGLPVTKIFKSLVMTHEILAQWDINKLVNQNKRSRKRPTHIWTLGYDKDSIKEPWGKNTIFSVRCVRSVVYLHGKK